MYLNDFKKFAENKGLQGKLNTHLTPQNLTEFLNERLQDLSPKSALDYVTGFNSMVQGLEQTKLNLDPTIKDVFKEYTSDYRNEFNNVKNDFETGRAVQNQEHFLNQVKEINETAGVVAELQLATGLRVSEALEVAKNFDKYYTETGELKGIIGKGGQEYLPKEITRDLAYKLKFLDQKIGQTTYYNVIKEAGHKTHDLRITFAKENYQKLRKEGYLHKEALKITSKELNHHRESITIYYLKRA